MLQLIIGSEQTGRHALPELLQLLFADEPCLVAVIPMDIGHLAEDVLFMPRRPQVDYPSALVTDILDVAVITISLLDDSLFQLVCQVIELVAHMLYLLRLVVPLLHLLRVLLHLDGHVVI